MFFRVLDPDRDLDLDLDMALLIRPAIMEPREEVVDFGFAGGSSQLVGTSGTQNPRNSLSLSMCPPKEGFQVVCGRIGAVASMEAEVLVTDGGKEVAWASWKVFAVVMETTSSKDLTLSILMLELANSEPRM